MKVELDTGLRTEIRTALRAAHKYPALQDFNIACAEAYVASDAEARSPVKRAPLYFWLGAEAEKVYDHT